MSRNRYRNKKYGYQHGYTTIVYHDHFVRSSVLTVLKVPHGQPGHLYSQFPTNTKQHNTEQMRNVQNRIEQRSIIMIIIVIEMSKIIANPPTISFHTNIIYQCNLSVSLQVSVWVHYSTFLYLVHDIYFSKYAYSTYSLRVHTTGHLQSVTVHQ